VPNLTNRSSKSAKFTFSSPTVSVFTFCIVFSLASFAFSNAQPYKTNVNDINWARFVAPSPLEMAAEPFNDYDDEERSEEGVIENEPMKGNKKESIPTAYEELDSILEDENDSPETTNDNVLRHQLEMKPHSSAQSSSLTRENVPPTSSGKLDPSAMTSHQLQGFLSQFYLIRTPYGYILGRHNPALSTTSISRRSMQPPKARMTSRYGSPRARKYESYSNSTQKNRRSKSKKRIQARQ